MEIENNLLAKKLKSIHSGHSKLNLYSQQRIKGNETMKTTKDNWFSEKEKAWELSQNNQRLAHKLRYLYTYFHSRKSDLSKQNLLKTTDQKFPIQAKSKDSTAHGWRVRNFDLWCDESQGSSFKERKLGQKQ